jgi:hypothetical protein
MRVFLGVFAAVRKTHRLFSDMMPLNVPPERLHYKGK